MFDVGFLEVSVIFVVALIVVGPEKLPGLARTVGLYVGKARRYADFVRREIENEVRTAELKALAEKPTVLNEVKDALTETVDTLKDTEQELKDDLTPHSKDSSPTNTTNEDSSEKTEQTLGDMAKASWSGPTKSTLENDKPVEATPKESPDSKPENTDSDEQRERTT